MITTLLSDYIKRDLNHSRIKAQAPSNKNHNDLENHHERTISKFPAST
jgi:hypothetical protein